MGFGVEWNLAEWLGYVSTWSSVRKAHEAGRDGLFATFAAEFEASWGAAETKRAIEWPLALRVGTLPARRQAGHDLTHIRTRSR